MIRTAICSAEEKHGYSSPSNATPTVHAMSTILQGSEKENIQPVGGENGGNLEECSEECLRTNRNEYMTVRLFMLQLLSSRCIKIVVLAVVQNHAKKINFYIRTSAVGVILNCKVL